MDFKHRGPRHIFERHKPKIKVFKVCFYCEVNSADSWDHILPYSYGGTEHPSNLVECCRGCNCMLSNLLLYSKEEKKFFIKLRIRGFKKKKCMEIIEIWREACKAGTHATDHPLVSAYLRSMILRMRPKNEVPPIDV